MAQPPYASAGQYQFGFKPMHGLRLPSIAHPELAIESFHSISEDAKCLSMILGNKENNFREIVRTFGDQFSAGAELYGSMNVDFASTLPDYIGGPPGQPRPPYYNFVKHHVIACRQVPPQIPNMLFMVRDTRQGMDRDWHATYDYPKGPAIGVTGFSTIEMSQYGTSSANLAVVIEPAYQRRGYGIECMMASIRWGFEYAQFDEITVLVNVANTPMLRRCNILMCTDHPEWCGPIKAKYENAGYQDVLFTMKRIDWRGWDYRVPKSPRVDGQLQEDVEMMM